MTTVRDLIVRARHTAPRRLPAAVGRFALRTARARARRWRLQQNAGELSDRAALAALRVSSVAEAVVLLRQASRPRCFVDAAEARERAAAIAERYPALAERTRLSAQRALDHEIDLLGSGLVALGPRIDWHTDFKVGYTWPRHRLADDLDYLTLGAPCDVKVPWELSRCHHWVALGRAYALDGDPRYAREFASQLDAWLIENPWPYGVNWGRAMEVAVRAVNWLWAAALFDAAPEFDDRSRWRLTKSLIQHGRHILANLEYADNNGNHYLSNGVGLVFLGVLYPEVSDAAHWRRKGFEIVWGEIERQVHADGVDFEQGIGYQGLVLEFWYACVLLCDLNNWPVPAHVRERVSKMFDFTLAVTRPDGSFPQVGDNDDGRLAGLDDEPPGSHRRHLAVGGAMFQRPELLAAAGDAVETAVWLCGTDVLAAPREARSHPSQAFPDGGFYVLRSDDAMMLVDCGEIGMRGIGGHGHADVLSFDLWAAGAPLLVDAGTYTYTADPQARQAMRSTAAHNAVRVDGEDVARLGNERWLWLLLDDAHPTVHTWATDARSDRLDAEHDGYSRLREPVTHRRTIVFDKRGCAWRITDRLTGAGTHLVEVFLHPAVPFEVLDEGVRLSAPRADAWLFPPTGNLRREPGWISRGYGHREPATVLVYAQRAPMPLVLETGIVLVPRGTSAADARSLFESVS